MKLTLAPIVVALALGIPEPGSAQSTQGLNAMDHGALMKTQGPTETGQSAFAVIAEIVVLLQADPHTDWKAVNIAALRAHLVDMDAVTLHAEVVVDEIEAGARFSVTSSDANVTDSIRRMLLAHGQVMPEGDRMVIESGEIAGGARMTVTGSSAAMIRGLGFFGVMTLGAHHQAHHLALARGSNPHGN